MPVVANRTKEKLAAGELAVGFGVRQARTADTAAIAQACGFDWLFIDMEHGSLDVDNAVQLCAAALPTGVTPIVRVPGYEHYHATRVLDGGAMGIIVPHVDTAEEARRVVTNCKYSPLGHRSVAGLAPQLGFEAYPPAEAMRRLNDNTLLVVMIESPQAVENAEAMAAVEGVDVLLIGAGDLSAEMGVPGQFGEERIEDAYRRVIDAARKHGKFAGMGGIYDRVYAPKYIQMGAQFLLGGSDQSFMMSAASERARFLKGIER